VRSSTNNLLVVEEFDNSGTALGQAQLVTPSWTNAAWRGESPSGFDTNVSAKTIVQYRRISASDEITSVS
jgi:hypothetical protein